MTGKWRVYASMLGVSLLMSGAAHANLSPLANAGPNQTAHVAVPVTLSGSASSDPDGDPLTFSWSVLSRPANSSIILVRTDEVSPSFIPDREGSYVIQLVVSDGSLTSSPSTVTITTLNTLPVASAGPDQTASVGSRVSLNGATSSDIDGDSLLYQWRIVSRPAGSAAALANVDPASPLTELVIDRTGAYVIELVVRDESGSSKPDRLRISTVNSAPVANAGPDQTTAIGNTVYLSAASSSDADGDPLTYRWSLTAAPGSFATLYAQTGVDSGFVVDKPRTYVAQLIVNDGKIDSAADTVVISTINSAPVAKALSVQPVYLGDTVTLDGVHSHDVDFDVLGFAWSLISRPIGSQVVLSSSSAPKSYFVPDVVGLYVAQLVVNDGRVDSAPDVTQVVVEVRPQPTAPFIAIGNPADGAITNNPVLVVSGHLPRWAYLTINGKRASLNEFFQFSTTVPLTPGVNRIVALARDLGGLNETVAITVVLDTAAPAAANGSLIRSTQTSAGTVMVSGANGSVEGNARVRVTNMRTGAAIEVVANADGAFSAELAGQPGDRLVIKVIDAANNESDDRELIVDSSSALTITVSQPLDGAVVSSRYLVVSGTVEGSSDVGITINEVIAAISTSGSVTTFTGRVRLEEGVNPITITARTVAGVATARTVSVSRQNSPPVELVAEPPDGIGPLTVAFDIERYAPIDLVSVSYDFNGDGEFDALAHFPEEPRAYTYPTPGQYTARVQVMDANQQTYQLTIPVYVLDQAALDQRLRGVWSRFSDALTQKDTSAATSLIAESAKDQYSEVFSELREQLPGIAASMSPIELVTLGTSFAEYAIARNIDGEQRVFFIDFIQDGDGVWRIAGM